MKTKTVKIELRNDGDLEAMYDDMINDGFDKTQALESVMQEVQLRTIMDIKYPEYYGDSEFEGNIVTQELKKIS